MGFDETLEMVKKKLLDANHTLAQAAEAEFSRGQFELTIKPNMANGEVWATGEW